MKKILVLIALFTCLYAIAQDIQLTETGTYEKIEVVIVDSAKATTLYKRAQYALREWTGPDGKAKVSIDYQDEESHIVIYKGTFSIGYLQKPSRAERWAEFILKVRCKDGKAQITMTVPQITISNAFNAKRSFSLSEVVNIKNKSRKMRRERINILLKDIKEISDSAVQTTADRLKGNANNSNNDDF